MSTANLLALVRSLPTSPLRPTSSPQLSNALESIINRMFAGKTLADQSQVIANMTGTVERLQAGSALQAHPLSNKTLRPPHDPLYYTRILEGVHRSAKGQGRSFWRRFFQLRGDA